MQVRKLCASQVVICKLVRNVQVRQLYAREAVMCKSGSYVRASQAIMWNSVSNVQVRW